MKINAFLSPASAFMVYFLDAEGNQEEIMLCHSVISYCKRV